ncbi:primosome assembly protein PriA [Bifidobacterium biavatii DSM 23969]|uniref:Primosome assembly protein PriA n=1 Tax=Bifidobacterium biavatii DSM 23969 TaxID=1437608 RepID=A0A087A1Y1_9BIFI|nr:primosome assembly protein PriA [Bifidobacterium biavatii DSM 23969]
MTTPHAEQLALDGLAPRKRRRRAPAEREPAVDKPIAQIVLDVQATHLGRTFDYLVDEKQSEQALPGTMVRVRFGGQRVSGIIWNRTDSSDTPESSMRYIERVLTPEPLVSAAMRRDVELIADAYGGTRANILRFAVPARVARVDQEQRLAESGAWQGRRRFTDAQAQARDAGFGRLAQSYDHARQLRDALEGTAFASFVVDALPGAARWARDLAWMIMTALLAGKSAVAVLPTNREVNDLAAVLTAACGLRPFAPNQSANGGYSGDFAILEGSAMPPAERYRAYRAVATGQVRCAIGARSAMYAPVEGPALFVIVDDLAYQNMDGFMPYPNARGVLRLRAKAHGGVFVSLANVRSPISQWETGDPSAVRETPTTGFSTAIRPLPAVVKEQSPWIRWLNRDELARLADPSIGARVPHTAVRILTKALERGPVLLSTPRRRHHRSAQLRTLSPAGALPALHRSARARSAHERRTFRWCGAAVVNWTCPGAAATGCASCASARPAPRRNSPDCSAACRSSSRRAASRADSSTRSPCRPQIVIATPGCEPRVLPVDGNDGAAGREYRAVAILDAWTSLYAPGVDARPDALANWMRSMALCAPRSRGGQGLLIGETDPVIAQSLMLWDSRLLAAKEIEERAQTGLPPVLAAACVWGRRDTVMQAIQRLGALPGGEWGTVNVGGEDMPAMLGPVPIPQPPTVNAREFADTADRVKAVVRVAQSRRAELAIRLRTIVARHVAAREPGELRFRLDPKDLI